MKSRLSVIIPAYNEEKRIMNTLEKYCEFFRNEKIEFEILVVLNNCKDGTLEIVKNSQKKFKEIIFLNFEKGGKGFAIIEGFKDSLKRGNDLIGFVDADMATPPNAFYDLVTNIKNYDGIIASRWLEKSVVNIKQSFLRRFVSRGFNFFVRTFFLFSYRDTQCGAKLFKRKIIEQIGEEIKLTEWAFDINLLYLCKKNKFKIKEIPTIWNDVADSKIRSIPKVSFQMFSGILRLRLIYSPLSKMSKILRPLVGWFWRRFR